VITATKPKVVIFSDHLLYPSETFIQAQGNALSTYEPVYAGSRRVAGLELPDGRVHTVNAGTFSGRFHELRFKISGSAPALVTKLRTLQPVLLHAHYGPNGLRTLRMARSLGVPHITTFHGGDAAIADLRHQKTYLGFRHYMANKSKLKAGGTVFIAVSKFVQRKLVEHGFPPERVLVFYTGVDSNTFRPASTEDQPVILFVGRFVEFKGIEFLIRAAGEVQRQFPAAELVIIGDGELRNEVKALAKQTLRRYRFLGVRTQQEVRDWMNRASLLCVPSVTTRSGEAEGFGMVCAEAQAIGKPVVGFDCGGISEVVAHGKTGLLAAERDWQTLASHLLLLLQHSELRESFGRAARESMVQNFDLHKCTAQLEKLYGRVLEARAARREEFRWHASAPEPCS
jgi:glycosyltransferase involved in cell wall biosynthesis